MFFKSCIVVKSKMLRCFDAKFFKQDLKSQFVMNENKRDLQALKTNRKELYMRDPSQGVDVFLKHLELDTMSNVCMNFEKRCILYDFNDDLSIDDITTVKKIAMNSKKINIFVLMYSNIEDWVKMYIKYCNITKGGNINSYYVNQVYDNRLIVKTLQFSDDLWKLGITEFRYMYSKVFKTNDVRGIDYIDEYPELKRTLVNLMKCSSLKRINDMFLQNVEMTTKRKEKDSIMDKIFYNDCRKSSVMEYDDKLLALFDITYDDDIKKIESILI